MLKYVLMFIIYFFSNDLVGQRDGKIFIHTEWEGKIFKEYTMEEYITKDSFLVVVPLKLREFISSDVSRGKDRTVPFKHKRTTLYTLYTNGRTERSTLHHYNKNGNITMTERPVYGDDCTSWLIEKTYYDDNGKIVKTVREQGKQPKYSYLDYGPCERDW